MHRSSSLYFIPFLAFISGYLLMSTLWNNATFLLPSIVGLPLHEAAQALSHHQLSLQIGGTKEEPHLPTSTILSQHPEAQTLVKKHQTISVVLSTQPQKKKSPALIGLKQEEAVRILENSGIKVKIFPVISAHPAGYCIAQQPHAHEPLLDPFMHIYISQAPPTWIIWPNMRGMQVENAVDQLASIDLVPTIHALPHAHQTPGTVIDQYPPAGSLFLLHDDKKPHVQLIICKY